MKALISVDLEGMPYIVIPGHLDLKGVLYEEARRIATKVGLVVAQELNKHGFDKIILADSHGPAVNLLVDDLPDYTELVRGFPRPLFMVAGVEDCDAALFLGYHAKFGTEKSTFDHTYSGASINKIEINGTAVSEFLFNAYVAGEFNVPVIMVAGEAKLINDDVKLHAPWVETVALKQSLSRVSARSPSMKQIEKELRDAATRAAASYSQGKAKVLTTEKPTKIRITFQNSRFADVAELLPKVKRESGLEIEYVAADILEAQKIFELLTYAGAGMTSLLESQR